MQHCSEREGASLAAQLTAEKCSLAAHQMVQDKAAQTNDRLPVNIYSHLTFERRVQHFLLLDREAAERQAFRATVPWLPLHPGAAQSSHPEATALAAPLELEGGRGFPPSLPHSC